MPTLVPLTAQREPPVLRGLLPLIAALGAPDFAARALGGLHDGGLRAGSWSVYRLADGEAPILHLSSSLGVADTTRQCFAAYLDGLYRADRSFDAVRRGEAALLRMRADEAPSSAHRDAIYRRHGMLERLSVVQRAADGGLLAVNLYRHEQQGLFSAGEFDGFGGLAPLLLATVQRHLALCPPQQSAAPDTRAALRRRCAELTERELDVCERLLRGWSYDGIAADLGLSRATVKTYRARAFERLGLHFKSELFAALRGAH
ncbi:response regulator transcription factor [Roseateles violae]|uniref:LuxR C-terminal-related transcriptional regulator n=1 Tax=Roseateles violae TaxID=3058042 RepID=A0ABT8DQR8_9BURK|nr:LuxR C-terminal-related transcriptional regulator [Pelomonas sp. PFR6]MDN3920690.1 LuxR C-terminal-related transcriptional regulator [Pelomonas sp. PFR6]